MKFEILKDEEGRWYWRIRSGGNTIGEGTHHSRKSRAVEQAQKIATAFSDGATFVDIG